MVSCKIPHIFLFEFQMLNKQTINNVTAISTYMLLFSLTQLYGNIWMTVRMSRSVMLILELSWLLVCTTLELLLKPRPSYVNEGYKKTTINFTTQWNYEQKHYFNEVNWNRTSFSKRFLGPVLRLAWRWTKPVSFTFTLPSRKTSPHDSIPSRYIPSTKTITGQTSWQEKPFPSQHSQSRYSNNVTQSNRLMRLQPSPEHRVCAKNKHEEDLYRSFQNMTHTYHLRTPV